MIKHTKPYVDSGKLKVITISHDVEETYPDLMAAISKHKLEYPVIYDGGVYSPEGLNLSIPGLEWDVSAVPTTFLINPQGVIVANYMWGRNKLVELLDFYLNGDRPIMGVLGSEEIHEDGKTVTITASVLNQGMGDVELQLNAYMSRLIWDENGAVYDSEEIDVTPESTTVTISFDGFSETTHEFVISPDESWHTLNYSLWLAVPGAEQIEGRRNRGYEILFSPDEILQINLKRVEGQWIVQQ